MTSRSQTGAAPGTLVSSCRRWPFLLAAAPCLATLTGRCWPLLSPGPWSSGSTDPMAGNSRRRPSPMRRLLGPINPYLEATPERFGSASRPGTAVACRCRANALLGR